MPIRKPARYWIAALSLLLLATPLRAAENLDAPLLVEQAQAELKRLNPQIKRTPKKAELYLERGNVYFQMRDLPKAIADYDQALRLNDKLDDAYFGRGMAYGPAGELERAIADLSVYLKRHPNSSLAYTKRGVRYIWKGERDNAFNDLTRAIELDPNNAEAHDDLGVLYAQRGELNQAAQHFATTIRIEPGYQKAHHNMALTLTLGGQLDRALVSINEALQLQNTRESLMLKSMILERLGRTEEAQWLKDEAAQTAEGGWTERAPVR
ncbi:MAG: tetratricopeptide repeat protein [Hydrogenophilales bacterium]|nr:tetratricopeptide repeat protein [Hydrogenophilales bacterium]